MNRLTLAVAGGRKTQSIVDGCVAAAEGRRILVLTYTQVNQRELIKRLSRRRPLAASVEVQGWFSFLMRHWIRPYVPLQFPGRRLTGLNFEGDPGRYATGERRFLDAGGRAYKLHLSKLAVDVSAASGDAVVDRLSRIYDEIRVDEVQDLNGCDLDILEALMKAPLDLSMVGDVRQAVLLTNTGDQRYKQFKGMPIKRWFDGHASRGALEIAYQNRTWRSNQAIADFADSIFADEWGFSRTVSENAEVTDHLGVYVVATDQVAGYVEAFAPLCLRTSAASWKELDLPFVTFGMSKGMSVDRVLIAPTGGQLAFLRQGTQLDDTPCCSLYVAITRARHSVAFVVDDPASLELPIWTRTPDGSPRRDRGPWGATADPGPHGSEAITGPVDAHAAGGSDL